MFKRFDICIVLFLLLNACYWIVLNALNTFVSPYVYFVLPAIFIVPTAIYMNFSSMLFVMTFTAFAVASSMPVNTFAVCAVWLIIGIFLNSNKAKFRILDWFSSSMLMQLVNVVVLVSYMVLLPMGAVDFYEYIKRIASDAAASGLLLCLCSNLCVSLPVSIMSFFDVDITSMRDY